EEPALWLLGRAACGSMRDALSLTDQAIAFGSGRISEADVRNMLGSVDLGYVYELLEAVTGNEPAKVLATVQRMAEHAPDFEGSLDELLSLIHRVATAQIVPDAIDNSWGDAERVTQLARDMTAEDAQLFYQVALNGKRDIALSPDLRRGFEMVLLRMIAFRPAAVIDDTLRPEHITSVPPIAAGEGSAQAKKPVEAPATAAVKSSPANARTSEGTNPVAPGSNGNPAGQLTLADLSRETWFQLLELLGIKGIIYNIASHCELHQRDGDNLQFVLDKTHAALFNDSHGKKLRLALENYFGNPVSVSVILGEPRGETPAMRLARMAQERQAEAIDAIKGDPLLQSLISRFDGELDHSSILPTDV
ncbi:MAG TPA: DNA polymerase III subunit gamma/tau C-terminal domain-containing protein, partial [Halioglobus sp.]